MEIKCVERSRVKSCMFFNPVNLYANKQLNGFCPPMGYLVSSA